MDDSFHVIPCVKTGPPPPYRGVLPRPRLNILSEMQPSGGIDSSASMALSQLGLATTPTTETQGSSSRARDPSQLATLSTDSLATSSEDSFGSLEVAYFVRVLVLPLADVQLWQYRG